MLVVIMLSVFLHSLVIQRGAKFFRQGGFCTDADKSIVSVLIGLSVMFIITQVVVWADNPWWFILKGSVGMSLMMGFNFANVFLYLALLHSMTSKRACSLQHSNTHSPR